MSWFCLSAFRDFQNKMRSEANSEIEVKCMCNTLNFNLPQFNKAYRLFWKLLFGFGLFSTVA